MSKQSSGSGSSSLRLNPDSADDFKDAKADVAFRKLQSVPAFEPKYLPTPGNPSMQWETWWRLFGYHLVGSGLSTASEQSRLASLYLSLGAEGARICASLCPDGTTFAQAEERLKARFGERGSHIYSRSIFHRRNQHSGEDIASYVTELRTLIVPCHYDAAFEEEVLRDRIVSGVRAEKIRERLFMEPNDLTLERCIELAESVERACSEASNVGGARSDTRSEPVGALRAEPRPGPPRSSAFQPRSRYEHQSRSPSRDRRHSRSSSRESNSRSCPNCGNREHNNRNQCPARNQTCHKCRGPGHFARVCRSQSKQHQRRNSKSPDRHSKPRSYQQSGISLIAGVRTNRNYKQFRHVKLWIGNRMQELLMDSGARVSVINRKMINSLSPKPVVDSSNGRNLITFTRSPIPIDGVVKLPVRYQSTSIPAFEFFVVKSGNPVMGTDLFNRLGFKVFDSNNIEIPASVNAIRSQPSQQPSSSATNSVSGPRPPSRSNSEARPPPTPSRSHSLPGPSASVPGSRSTYHPIVAKYPSIVRADPTRHIKHFQHKPRIDYSVRPVVQAQRRIPLALLDSVEEELRRMQKCDVLEPIETSSWVSNMVVVPKANGAVRLCCDLSDLNKAVIPDRYPLPTVDELSRFFAGSHYFSKIDLKWGYLQILLHPSVRHLTAMITPLGLFQWKRLPFGLSSAPSYFQMVMSIITKGLDGVKFLMDDIIVCGRSKSQHDSRLEKLCKRLHDYNVLINEEKSTFGVTTVDFVGHTVSADGVKPLKSNITAIENLEVPTNCKKVRSLLGAANFYRKFIPHFSDIVEPLVALTRKEEEFVWSVPHQTSLRSAQEIAYFGRGPGSLRPRPRNSRDHRRFWSCTRSVLVSSSSRRSGAHRRLRVPYSLTDGARLLYF